MEILVAMSLLLYESVWFDRIVVLLVFFFFFQAEDGIRDLIVTGVQTCALPIYRGKSFRLETTRRQAASAVEQTLACHLSLCAEGLAKRKGVAGHGGSERSVEQTDRKSVV